MAKTLEKQIQNPAQKQLRGEIRPHLRTLANVSLTTLMVAGTLGLASCSRNNDQSSAPSEQASASFREQSDYYPIYVKPQEAPYAMYQDQDDMGLFRPSANWQQIAPNESARTNLLALSTKYQNQLGEARYIYNEGLKDGVLTREMQKYIIAEYDQSFDAMKKAYRLALDNGLLVEYIKRFEIPTHYSDEPEDIYWNLPSADSHIYALLKDERTETLEMELKKRAGVDIMVENPHIKR